MPELKSSGCPASALRLRVFLHLRFLLTSWLQGDEAMSDRRTKDPDADQPSPYAPESAPRSAASAYGYDGGPTAEE